MVKCEGTIVQVELETN